MWQRSTVMLDIERVDFVSVPTRDVARARRFYRDVLGLAPSAVNPDEFETPNLTLALWRPEPKPYRSCPTPLELRPGYPTSRPRGDA
jgi:catechol 2,3-dioxygenase-like lactoylglutathione lyase family enzyme